MAANQITIKVLNLKHNFHKEIKKFPKILMKKCLKMVSNFSELLFYSQDCMLNILTNFCIITTKNTTKN